jgi:hypothetical protein
MGGSTNHDRVTPQLYLFSVLDDQHTLFDTKLSANLIPNRDNASIVAVTKLHASRPQKDFTSLTVWL